MTDQVNIPDNYGDRLRLIKLGLLPKEAVAKKKKPMKRVSDKKRAEDKAAKEALGEDETMKEKWFKARRKEMVGVCQCGCTQKSSKHDDLNFRSSAAHIFPQRLFPSIQYHRLNWVERAIWATITSSSCHTNMDNQSMDLWPNFADWEDIKAKFYELSTLLTDEERATKFYSHLENLVYDN
jgi:hypothetical protein